jgi:hypothetical protein
LSNVVSSSTPALDFLVKSSTTSSFDKLTVEIVLAQFRSGTLPEAVLLYLLAGVGLPA